MSWYATKKASKLPYMNKNEILVFDLETTGLEAAVDEILQITILDGYGSELFSSYIKPTRHRIWPGAQRVNGIKYEMVKDAPTFRKVRKEIQEIFNKA
ncbi:MAG: 3'-5' exonuclease, partial [Oscillospiraceae bacterium]|nr:3'-5' exonuclease [Oscillospiraceae bacterium]